MLGEIKDIMTTSKYKHEFPSIEQIVVTSWDKMTIPLHYLGFALMPRFYEHIYLKTPALGGFTRKTPNLDREVVLGCMEAFEESPLELEDMRWIDLENDLNEEET
ncbi:hypothetical protein V6N13_072353 [Hibiscus sabdariffa]